MILTGDNLNLLKTIETGSIDLTVTSPPYDNLRDYDGFPPYDLMRHKNTAKELFRVTKQGGVVVWVVGDATVKGSETGTSFRQALIFKKAGFNLHDTMIYHREKITQESNRYQQHFEYMFVLSKGSPTTVNRIKEPSKSAGRKRSKHSERWPDGSAKMGRTTTHVNEFKVKGNVWKYNVGYMHNSTDKISYNHPATFPEQLAHDHILSWSNEGDTVLDIFAGSGTTLKMAKKLNRKYIGMEISKDYVELINERINTGPLFTEAMKNENKL